MVSGHYTHLFSRWLVNEAAFGYAQMFGPMAIDLSADVLKGIQRSTYGFNAGQLNPANNPMNFVPAMTFGGVTGAASLSYDGRFPYFLTRYATNISDSLSATLGSHLLKAGIFIERMRQYDGGWA